jgi:hypothetical protein
MVKQEHQYRVHLDPDGKPAPLRAIRRRRREAGLVGRLWQSRPQHKAIEIQFAESLIRERQQANQEKPPRFEFLRHFEDVLVYLEARKQAIREEALQYANEAPPSPNGEGPEYRAARAQHLLKELSPIRTIANRPATFLSQPLPILDQDQWQEVTLLTSAAQSFYSREHTINGFVGKLLGASLTADANALSQRIADWTREGRFEQETILTFFKALARIRNADCLYYGGMYLPGKANPNTFISNLAFVYEKTADNLTNGSGTNGDQATTEVAECLSAETVTLRVIQAQKYTFTTHDRPVDYNSVLLPTAAAVTSEIKHALETTTYRPRDFARKIIGAFRSRRCDLSDQALLAICSFFQGKVVPKELAKTDYKDYHLGLPWIILSQQQESKQKRFETFRQAPTYAARIPALCRALSKVDLETDLTAPLVPHIVLEARKMGYLQDVSQSFYQKLDLNENTWRSHQRELSREKEPLQLNQGDVVVFVPLSGWCLTGAHTRLAEASQSIGRTVIQCLEITAKKPLSERKTKVIFTFGEYGPKKERGMPDVATRSQLATIALRHYRNIHAASPGEIDETQERSGRVKELMDLYSERFGISWSSSTNGSYPDQGCVALLAGATEKLGSRQTGRRAKKYVSQEDKPREDIEFLNQQGQIFALLQEDISPAQEMAELVTSLTQSFQQAGIAIVATHFPELHSTAAAHMVENHFRALLAEEPEKAEKARAAFATMIPPAIIEPAWRMMMKRIADETEDQALRRKLLFTLHTS